ncbi:MAG TPA: putative hydroxymethylpyrimidine transporter CytX [Firmicutes bacterium]|jgi:putative hydroxymethylpyrimidine transporter CytX|nr:putative hydroxymethylpyrimidine transporter CytX [Bacillota bacterium]
MSNQTEFNHQTSNLGGFLLWMGAAISIAEIQTGVLLAPLGISKGIIAILIGHIIGAITLYAAGMIGASGKLSSMESTRISFGVYGSYGFSILNILQLLGWTAIMIIDAADALDEITRTIWHFQNVALWCVLIGAFIVIWILLGLQNLSKVNIVVVGLLFVLCIVLGFIVFSSKLTGTFEQQPLSFGAGVELNVTMSLSWLPLIADYTRYVKHPKAGTGASVLGYFAGSMLMFTIGLGAAIYSKTSDISAILMSTGLGIVALMIVIFSTVTTTFMDVYSAGVSAVNLHPKINANVVALSTCIMGAFLAIMVPMSQYENFLYWIGSVFSPLFAILLADYFLSGEKRIDSKRLLNLKNTVLWIVGVVIYRLLLLYNSPIGVTLPVMVMIGILCLLVNGGIRLWNKKFQNL